MLANTGEEVDIKEPLHTAVGMSMIPAAVQVGGEAPSNAKKSPTLWPTVPRLDMIPFTNRIPPKALPSFRMDLQGSDITLVKDP